MEDDVLVDPGVVWEDDVAVRSCYYDVVLCLCWEDMWDGGRELYLSLSVEDYFNRGFVSMCLLESVGGVRLFHRMEREFKRSVPVDVLLDDDAVLVDFLLECRGARGVFLCVGGAGECVPVECAGLYEVLRDMLGDKFRSYKSEDDLMVLRRSF